jgi:hypothetical protein
MRIELTQEQQIAYGRYIKARDRVGLGKKRGAYVPHTSYFAVEVTGMNHPMYVENTLWIEYLEASLAWWKVEPAFRNEERMRASRGDYGSSDDWSDPSEQVRELL